MNEKINILVRGVDSKVNRKIAKKGTVFNCVFTDVVDGIVTFEQTIGDKIYETNLTYKDVLQYKNLFISLENLLAKD